MTLSIIIPAYNEEQRLPPTLTQIQQYLAQRQGNFEVIVVDDGSRDATAAVVERFARNFPQLKLIKQPQNRGKGCAVRTGALASQGERVLFADADGSTPIVELERLERAIDQGADVAIGSRALRSEDTSLSTKWYRKFLGRMFNKAVNLIVLPGIADTQCGFKLFTRPAAQFVFSRQQSDGFSFDVEILYLARRGGFKIAEVAVNWQHVPGSKVNLVLDAAKMLRDAVIFRFRHRKVGRF